MQTHAALADRYERVSPVAVLNFSNSLLKPGPDHPWGWRGDRSSDRPVQRKFTK